MSATAVEAPVRSKKRRQSPQLRLLVSSTRLGRTRLGLGLAFFVLVVAFLGPTLAPHSPTASIGLPFAGPSSAAPLGTDALGRDVLSRVLYGGESVIWMSCAAAMLGVGLGVLIGMSAGYARPGADSLLMRGMDVLMAFPNIVLVLLFVSLLGSKLWLIVLLVAAAWTPQVARVARGITVETRAKEFIQAAEVLGVPRRRILINEILPNLATPLLVEFGLRLTWSIALIAAISFLGFGIQPPKADWGLMINENRQALGFQPWAAVVPIFMIAVLTVAANLMTDGIGRTVAGIDRKKSNS